MSDTMHHAITPKGEPMIVLTAEEYRTLVEDAGDLALARAARIADEGLPTLTADASEAVVAGTLHPLTAWRTASGLTIAALAEKSGVRAATISELENGKIDPRLSTLRALAGALKLDLGDIV